MQNENHIQIHMVCNQGRERNGKSLWKAYWMRNKSRVSYSYFDL